MVRRTGFAFLRVIVKALSTAIAIILLVQEIDALQRMTFLSKYFVNDPLIVA
jgi:hypothetical protein